MKPYLIKKECKIHGKTDFAKRKNQKSYSYRCKKCESDRVIRIRQKRKKQAVDHLGGKCVDCGYDKCLAALHFHHRDESTKEFGISASGITRSWDKLKKELDKCDLLCSNCHAERHWLEDELGR